MISKTLSILAIIFVVSSAMAGEAKGEIPDPVKLLKNSTKSVQLILKKVTESSAPEEITKTQEELKAEVNKLLDFDELATRALGQHKKSLTEKQVDEFNSLLRELIERAYTNRIKGSKDFEIKITKKEIESDNAFVEMIASADGKSAKTAYRLHKKDGKWIAYDFIIEDVSLVKQYKTQFNKIIAEKGFDILINKMKTKINELDKAKEESKKEKKPAPTTDTTSK